ncbi:MAG: hypothetical protein NTZ56_07205 [Acidobacteria bacterium]|nr:hypothetical protein [Acidobacteriota bacterium]
MKDIATKAEKLEALGAFSFQDLLEGEDSRNALLIDDLFDTGASLESACKALRGYQKINRLYVAALTWK